MDISNFDVACHDLDAVARLIYLTDKDISSLLFGKDMQSAKECIKKLMFIGGNSHSLEYVHVAASGRAVDGILICFDGAQKRAIDDDRALASVSCNMRKIALLVLGRTLNHILTKDIDGDELYISNISVNPSVRGRGIGTKLVSYAKCIGKERGCKSVLLDVSTKNTGAYRLYERLGFVPYTTRSSLLLGRNCVTAMRCVL